MPRPVRGAQHRELTNEEGMDLLGWADPAFSSDEERRAAWEEHGPRMLETRDDARPGTRPKAYWDYTPGAPQREDFRVIKRGHFGEEVERVDSDAHWEAEIRFLAERGELREDELQRLADDIPAKANWMPEAQENARRRLDAALEGLAERDKRQEGGRDGRRVAKHWASEEEEDERHDEDDDERRADDGDGDVHLP